MNQALSTALLSVLAAQALKIPTHYMNDAEWDVGQFFESGGLPSSHSAGVTSLATYIGLDKGFTSSQFAIASMLGMIVMYDAAGIRRHAGKTAVQVNDLDEDMERLAGDHPGIYHIRREKKLKERLGHQPVEVLAGALLGIGIGALSYALKPKSEVIPDTLSQAKSGFFKLLEALR